MGYITERVPILELKSIRVNRRETTIKTIKDYCWRNGWKELDWLSWRKRQRGIVVAVPSIIKRQIVVLQLGWDDNDDEHLMLSLRIISSISSLVIE